MTTLTFQKHSGVTTVGLEDYIDGGEIYDLLKWLDNIPFTRPRKNVCKDFSDGVMVAEIIKHYFPKMVELHNYPPASGTKQKLENWYHLQKKVLHQLNMVLSNDLIRAIVHCKPRVIERILIMLRIQIDNLLQKQGRRRKDVDVEYKQKQKEQASKEPDKQDSTPDKTSKHNSQVTPKDSKQDPDNSRALVPVLNKNSDRSPPAKSPRRSYGKGEIPHNHPDRSSYADKRILFDSGIPFHPYMYRSDNVPRFWLEEKELECIQKDETINMLTAKIRNLEQLVDLKQSRIEDLQRRLVQSKGLYYVTTGGTHKLLR